MQAFPFAPEWKGHRKRAGSPRGGGGGGGRGKGHGELVAFLQRHWRCFLAPRTSRVFVNAVRAAPFPSLELRWADLSFSVIVVLPLTSPHETLCLGVLQGVGLCPLLFSFFSLELLVRSFTLPLSSHFGPLVLFHRSETLLPRRQDGLCRPAFFISRIVNERLGDAARGNRCTRARTSSSRDNGELGEIIVSEKTTESGA